MTHITAVVTADNHLGTYYARLRPDRLHQRREYLQRGFQQAVETAIDRKAQLLLIAGDLFDRPDPRNADRMRVACELARLRRAGVTVVAVCGNHDSPRNAAYDSGIVPLSEMEALEGLRLLREPNLWSELLLELTAENGETVPVRIRGASYDFGMDSETCPLQTWVDGLAEPDLRTRPVEVAMLHYGVDGWGTPHAAEPVLSRPNLERITADLIAIGHLHIRNQARLASGALLLNPGATERIHFGEESHDTGCYVVRLGPGQPTESEFVPFERQPMKTVTISGEQMVQAIGAGEPAEAMPYLESRIQDGLDSVKGRAPETLLRIRLEGTIPETVFNALDLNNLRTWAQQLCFHCEIQTDDLLIRYRDMELAIGSGGYEIDQELTAIVDQMLAQVDPEALSTPAEKADAERKRRVFQAARDTLLTAYQRIRVG